MDRRLWPGNRRVVLATKDTADSALPRVPGVPATVIAPSTPLRDAPGGRVDKDLLFGEPVTVIEQHEGSSFLRSDVDAYVGYAESAALGPRRDATHRVTSALSHFYDVPDIKSPALGHLSFGSLLQGGPHEGTFLETPQGWVPVQHVTPLTTPLNDPAEVAERLIGTPYLWGGNTGWGIDCSGLIQQALLTTGRACPRDSDMQVSSLGTVLPEDAPLQRTDLIFWRGHVGMMLDDIRLIHANAHHMAVAVEPVSQAIARIAQAEFGEVRARKRL